MSSQVRKTYDTDVITLRRIFAVDRLTNTPISSGYILASAGSKGEAIFQNPFQISSIASLQIGLSTLSTTIGSGGAGDVTKANLVSTVAGLGTSGYLSSVSLIDLISTPNLASTVAGLGTSGYISSLQLLSSFQGLPNIAVTKLNAGTGITITPVTAGEFTITNSAAGGVGVNTDQLFSTVAGLGTAGYLSSVNLVDLLSTPNLVSTVKGLGTLGYISTQQLTSTTNGILTNLIPPFFTSTVEGLGTSGYVSTPSLLNLVSTLYLENVLTSTITGLGTVGYISTVSGGGGITTDQLTSTVTGLGTSGYISTPSLLNFVSTFYLENVITSTVQGLGSAGYISTLSGNSGGVIDTQLISTMYQAPSFSTIRIGYIAGNNAQSNLAVAIGATAGSDNQGVNSVAIGAGAGQINMPASTIVISAMGDALNPTNTGFFVAPIRNVSTTNIFNLGYNSTTNEIATFTPGYVNLVVSTLNTTGGTADPFNITLNDLGKYFVVTIADGCNANTCFLPSHKNGWTVNIKNTAGSPAALDVQDNGLTSVTTLLAGSNLMFASDGSSWYTFN